MIIDMEKEWSGGGASLHIIIKISLPTRCFSFSPPEFPFIPFKKSSVNADQIF
jgi:hypothetical protein